MQKLCNASATAGTPFSGVRPSLGAAGRERRNALDLIEALEPLDIAAPEDGRTPPKSASRRHRGITKAFVAPG